MELWSDRSGREEGGAVSHEVIWFTRWGCLSEEAREENGNR